MAGVVRARHGARQPGRRICGAPGWLDGALPDAGSSYVFLGRCQLHRPPVLPDAEDRSGTRVGGNPTKGGPGRQAHWAATSCATRGCRGRGGRRRTSQPSPASTWRWAPPRGPSSTTLVRARHPLGAAPRLLAGQAGPRPCRQVWVHISFCTPVTTIAILRFSPKQLQSAGRVYNLAHSLT